jgi:acetyl esterase/lipase
VRAALNALAATGGHTRVADIAYGALPRQRRDLYAPAGAAPRGGWPVVVFFDGGTWNSGERAQYAFVGAALASRGILTLVADYRLYPAVRYPDFLADSA